MSRRDRSNDTGPCSHPGCREYDALSRRSFLGLSGTFLAMASTPAWLPRVAYADSESGDRDIIVSIFLRGGWDGLSVCVPYTESSYYALRPTIAVPPPDAGSSNVAVDLDGRFGLPPALAPLLDAYQDGNLLLVHATGSIDPTRSHFDAMRFMETGAGSDQPTLFTGWLGRHLQTTAPTQAEGVVRAISLGFAVPQSLAGGPQTLPVADAENYGLAGNPRSEFGRRRALERMYGGASELLQRSAENTLATIDLLDAIDFAGYQPSGGAEYPDGELGTALKSIAALIKADVGAEAFAVDYGGWDTHENQAPLDGSMSFVMGGFAQSLAAFHQDLFSDDRSNLIVTAMSEFGRNALENGSRGTDHGHGGVMMLLGGSIAGGRVLTEWPGLANELLYEGQDLEITIDYRDILTEIVTKRLGNDDFRNVFPDPGFTPIDRGAVLG